MLILKLANGIGKTHAKFFMWLSQKSESNPWVASLLTLAALYEITEHLLGPTLAILYASGHITIN